jgi:hypothetical protein
LEHNPKVLTANHFRLGILKYDNFFLIFIIRLLMYNLKHVVVFAYRPRKLKRNTKGLTVHTVRVVRLK